MGVASRTVNYAVLDVGHQMLISSPSRFGGGRVIGVDEQVWRHAPGGYRYVRVIVDLAPIRGGTGPSRLLEMIPGQLTKVRTSWLKDCPARFLAGIEEVTMDGFTGFKAAATEQLPAVIKVVAWPGTHLTAVDITPSSPPSGTGGNPGTLSTASAAPCAPRRTY